MFFELDVSVAFASHFGRGVSKLLTERASHHVVFFDRRNIFNNKRAILGLLFCYADIQFSISNPTQTLFELGLLQMGCKQQLFRLWS